ncbi:hypothetical protein [Ferrimonas marina]|uniref:Uncharacterized protein n=1 Tax=Ferrimonas marina TaxID=299255 RepID=A0A1M5U5E5_9GAMM|nr:hypothetical protein [Ferrimonas marina]SHH58184.1 hypothetical protein SAMN02745129_2415 [Ferrimonas marina]
MLEIEKLMGARLFIPEQVKQAFIHGKGDAGVGIASQTATLDAEAHGS